MKREFCILNKIGYIEISYEEYNHLNEEWLLRRINDNENEN